MNKNKSKIIIKSIRFKNFISSNEEFFLNFQEKYDPIREKTDFFQETLFKKRANSKQQHGAMKMIGIIGRNSSYKTTTLKAVNVILNLLKNLTCKNMFSNFISSEINNNFEALMTNVEKWRKNKGLKFDGTSSLIKSYMTDKEVIKNTLIRSSDDYSFDSIITKFYSDNSFLKEQELSFEIDYFVNNIKKNISLIIMPQESFATDKKVVNYIFKINKKERKRAYFEKNLIEFNELDYFEDFKIFYSSLPDLNIEQEINNAIEEIIKILKFDNLKINDFFYKLDPSITNVAFVYSSESKRIINFSIERKNNNIISKNQKGNILSHGTKIFLIKLIKIIEKDFIIIDEIETSLHLRYVELLIDIIKSMKKQIIFTTHSPLVVEKTLNKKQIYIYDLSDDGKVKAIKASKILKPTNSIISNYMQGIISSPGDVNMNDIFAKIIDA